MKTTAAIRITRNGLTFASLLLDLRTRTYTYHRNTNTVMGSVPANCQLSITRPVMDIRELRNLMGVESYAQCYNT